MIINALMNKNEPLIVHDQQIYGSELKYSILSKKNFDVASYLELIA